MNSKSYYVGSGGADGAQFNSFRSLLIFFSRFRIDRFLHVEQRNFARQSTNMENKMQILLATNFSF